MKESQKWTEKGSRKSDEEEDESGETTRARATVWNGTLTLLILADYDAPMYGKMVCFTAKPKLATLLY